MNEDIPKSRFDGNSDAFISYLSTFIQRKPKHGIRDVTWRTVDTPITDDEVLSHLRGETILGTLAPWYPAYAIIDVDDAKGNVLDSIRKQLHLSDESSIVYETSPGSYHLLFRPQYNGEPATVDLMHTILDPPVRGLSKSMRASGIASEVVVYPQSNRVIRAPFHPSCPIIDKQLMTLEAKVNHFMSLQPIDLKSFSKASRQLAKQSKLETVIKPTKGEFKSGAELYEFGLQSDSEETRFRSQYYVALWLWRMNMTPGQALEELMHWVRFNTNGHSSDAKAINRGDYRTEQRVRAEHESLVRMIWDTFESYGAYPTSTHNGHYGWFAKADFLTAAKHSGGNIPRFKFVCKLLAYFNSHRSTRLHVHRDKLIDWSSARSYLKYVQELEATGLISREHHYAIGDFSKVIQLNIKPSFVSINDPAAYTDGLGQALDFGESLEEIGRADLYQMLIQNKVSVPAACQFLRGRCL